MALLEKYYDNECASSVEQSARWQLQCSLKNCSHYTTARLSKKEHAGGHKMLLVVTLTN